MPWTSFALWYVQVAFQHAQQPSCQMSISLQAALVQTCAHRYSSFCRWSFQSMVQVVSWAPQSLPCRYRCSLSAQHWSLPASSPLASAASLAPSSPFCACWDHHHVSWYYHVLDLALCDPNQSFVSFFVFQSLAIMYLFQWSLCLFQLLFKMLLSFTKLDILLFKLCMAFQDSIGLSIQNLLYKSMSNDDQNDPWSSYFIFLVRILV